MSGQSVLKMSQLNMQAAELRLYIYILQAQAIQQGVHESLFRDMMVGFGTWEFDPMDLENPFPNGEGSVHLWQGDEDRLVPVILQQYISRKLPWIHYHEIPGSGHLIAHADGMTDAIIKALLLGEKVTSITT